MNVNVQAQRDSLDLRVVKGRTPIEAGGKVSLSLRKLAWTEALEGEKSGSDTVYLPPRRESAGHVQSPYLCPTFASNLCRSSQPGSGTCRSGSGT